MITTFMLYWLLAGFIAFYWSAKMQGGTKYGIQYDDSYWLIVFGGFISLLAAILFSLGIDFEDK